MVSQRLLPRGNDTEGTTEAAIGAAHATHTRAIGGEGEEREGAREAVSVWHVLRSPRNIFFFVEMMCLGIATTVVEKFIFVFVIDELGGSQSLCGFSVAVTVIFELPLFHFGEQRTTRLHHKINMLPIQDGFLHLRWLVPDRTHSASQDPTTNPHSEATTSLIRLSSLHSLVPTLVSSSVVWPPSHAATSHATWLNLPFCTFALCYTAKLDKSSFA